MTKARTAKVLATAAAANIAAAGLMASPASASAQSASVPAADTTATTGRSHPDVVVIKFDPKRGRTVTPEQIPPAIRAAMAKARASASTNAGFVPKAAKGGVKPATETGCDGAVCLGLYGGGNYVDYVNTSWTTGTGCHIGHISYWIPDPNGSYQSFPSSTYICKNQEYQIDWYVDFPTGTSFCGSFNNINGGIGMCEEVR